MQYKGYKKVKRAAAVILSAALMITGLPQNVYAAQTGEAVSGSVIEQENTIQQGAVIEQEAESTEPLETDSKTEVPQTEDSLTEESEVETPETKETAPSEITDSVTDEEVQESEPSQLEPSGTEGTESEITEPESSETETYETELSEEETETAETVTDIAVEAEVESVPIPDVDSTVHVFKKNTVASINAASPVTYAYTQDPVQISANEYRIENKDQFFGFLSGKSDYDGCTITLACDIDMKSEIASFNGSFAGIFDGDGHSIHHIKVEQGLFPVVVSGAEIKNIHISDAAMTGTKSAGVIATRNDGRISHCVVTGNLESTSTMDYLGGIAGTNEGTIEDCVFAGQITAAAATADAEKDIGGIVGRNNGRIENCYAVGSISTKAAAVAGIAGTNSSRDAESIKNCANYMSVDGAYTVAGIVGINEGNVVDCSNYGPVRQKNHYLTEGEAGGIAAQNKVTGVISRCYNYASVAGEEKNIGGIAAATAGQISECGNYGAVSGSENIGGIVGLYNGLREHSISSCFNQGNVTGNGTTIKAVGIGGILGSADSGYKAPIENCYSTGSIRGSRSTRYIGGIAGTIKKGFIRNCYTAGSVSGYGEESYAAMLAGFLGKEEDASYADCLYISGSSKYACYRETGGVLEAEMERTANELKTQDALSVLGGSYSEDSSNVNNGYPILNGQNAPSYAYPVVYELNGGYSQSAYYDIVEKNETVNKPEDPAKQYAEFEGWYNSSGLSTPFQFNTQITAPTAVYAKWKADALVEDMELAQSDIELIKGEEYTIKVRYTPENAQNTEMFWESDDMTVATVDENGRIRAEAPGTARIRGSLKDNSLSKTLEFKVTVTNKEHIIHIRRVDDGVEVKSMDIAVKETVTLEAVATGFSEKATIQWTSGEEGYVKVTPRTNALGTPKADVEGIKPTPSGKPVLVRFSVIDGDITATGSVEVTVLPLATDVKVKLGEEDVTDKTVTYDLVTKKFIAVGTNKLKSPVEAFSASISPGNASQKVTWSSSNSSVIKFDDKESGAVTGKLSGTAEITAMAKDGSNKAGKTTVRTKRIVQSLVLEPKEVSKTMPVVMDSQGRVLLTSGCSVKLVPKFSPVDVTDERLSWKITEKSSNDTPIEIDSEKQTVTAKDVKTETKVTLTATSLDEGGASFDIELVIIPKITEIEIYHTADLQHPVNGKTIGIDPETDSMSFTLRVKNSPENASQIALWKSSNTKTATVEDHEDGSCTVNAKGYGNTVITATAADGSGVKASVTVNVSSLVSSIMITGSRKVAKGGTIKLSAEVLPKSAANKSVVWETDMPSIVTVDKATGQVTGKTEGLAVIKATAADGSGVKDEITLIVTKPVEKFDLMVPDGNDNADDDVIVTDKVVGIDLDAGMETYTLAARILPEETCQTVEWKSSNEKIATVDENGVITAKALGKAVITASATDGSGKKAKVTVNVATLVRSVTVSGSHYVGVGQSIQLKAAVTDKDAANKNVNWSSSDKNAVIVDGSGLVTAVSRNGYAVITAEAADGSGKSAEHIVYVMGKSDEIKITDFNDSLIETENNKKTAVIDIKDRQPMTVSFIAELSGGSERQEGYDKKVEWKTSDTTIAEVSSVRSTYGGSEVSLALKKAGTVTITAKTTDGSGKTDTCTLKVENTDPNVTITGPRQVANGKKIQLSAGGVAVQWESLDPSLATVAANGKVTAKKNVTGNVTIKATSQIGTEKSDTYEIFVGPAVTKVDIVVNGETVTNKKLGIDLIKEYNGSPLKLSANVSGASFDDSVTWKSNKTAIADVSEDGSVEIKKTGTAVITATATDGSNKKAKVTLVIAKQVTKIEPADGSTDVYVGYKKSVQLSLTYKPLAATTKKVTWAVEDGKKDIVSVSSGGKVTAKKYMDPASYVTVTATAADSGTAYCEFHIYVTAPPAKVQILELNGTQEQEYVSTVGIDIDTGEAKTILKASLTNTTAAAVQYGVCQKVTWKSSNTAIAEVQANDDGSCTVTGLANGKVTITATAADGSKKAGKITLYVGKLIKTITAADDIKDDGITLYVKSNKDKKTLQLSEKININPITATNKTLTYKSSDAKVVSVSAKGKLTAKKKGDATITISATDGSRTVLVIPVKVMQ